MSGLGNLNTCRPQSSAYEGFLYGLSIHCFYVIALQKMLCGHWRVHVEFVYEFCLSHWLRFSQKTSRLTGHSLGLTL